MIDFWLINWVENLSSICFVSLKCLNMELGLFNNLIEKAIIVLSFNLAIFLLKINLIINYLNLSILI